MISQRKTETTSKGTSASGRGGLGADEWHSQDDVHEPDLADRLRDAVCGCLEQPESGQSRGLLCGGRVVDR
jgi:hypothetical protein